MTRMIALAVAASLIVAACASPGSDDVERLPGEGTSSTLSGPPATPEDPASSGLADPGNTPPAADDSDSLVPGGELPPGVAFATEDLARHLDVSVDDIDWVSFQDVAWPDGALGCPQPGMFYTQAVVAGSLIVFGVEGVAYEYHASEGSDPFLCLPSL